MRSHKIIAGLCVVLFAVQQVGAEVVSVGAAKDNTLYQDAGGTLSNGAGEFLFAGNTGGGLARRGLAAFDLSAIPAGSTINSVTMTLHMSMTGPGATDVSLHTLLADWGEGASDATGGEGGGAAAATGDATWIHTFFNTSFWSSAGGDFSAASSATLSVGGVGFYSWSSTQMAADVQQWVNNPSTNFGWLLRGNEAANNTTKRFDTRENATLANRPVLMVEYTPVPGPWGMTVWVVVMVGRRRKRFTIYD